MRHWTSESERQGARSAARARRSGTNDHEPSERASGRAAALAALGRHPQRAASPSSALQWPSERARPRERPRVHRRGSRASQSVPERSGEPFPLTACPGFSAGWKQRGFAGLGAARRTRFAGQKFASSYPLRGGTVSAYGVILFSGALVLRPNRVLFEPALSVLRRP